jgi:membrane protease YdiL (CAAX protease family)
VLIFGGAFVLTVRSHGMSMRSITPLEIDASLAIQFVLEGLLVALLLAVFPRLAKISLRDAGFVKPTGTTLAWAVGGALVMAIVANGSASLLDHYFVHSKHEQDVVEIFKSLHDRVSIGIFIFFAIAFAPIAEETIFRVFFFNLGLRYGGFWTGAIVSGVLFGLAHGDLTAALPLALGGVVLCYVYYRSRNAYASMISHGLFNALSIAALLFAPGLTST